MLKNFIPDKSFAIVAGYCQNDIIAVLGGVLYAEKNAVGIIFPRPIPSAPDRK